jgi:methyl-accepting chemotaxis protein
LNSRKDRRKWRTILVRPSLQFHVALAHSLLVVVVILIFVLTLLGTLHVDLYGSGQLWLRYASGELLFRLLGRFLIAIVAALAVSFLFHVVFSHRLVGPLVNITHTLARMGEKDFTRKVFLRRTDFLAEEAEKVNEVLVKLGNAIRELKTVHSEVVSATSQFSQENGEERLRHLLDRQQSLLDQWLIDDPAAND